MLIRRMFDFRTYARKSSFPNQIKRKTKQEVTFLPDVKLNFMFDFQKSDGNFCLETSLF